LAKPAPQPDLIRGPDGRKRCFWCGSAPEYLAYHDVEWGFPVRDDRRLFEKLCLEGFQSGLSWITILRKRESFRAAFANFEMDKVARFGPAKVRELLEDASIVRHRGKIEASIQNAKSARAIRDEHGTFAAYVWKFEATPSNRPKRINRALLSTMTTSAEAIAMSKDLKKRGFAFVGPTTVYAFMQAMGLVNDHLDGCLVRDEAERRRKSFTRPK
jgi:DNA-3-methyladenine glycosylase I